MTASDANPPGAALSRALTSDEQALIAVLLRSDKQIGRLIDTIPNLTVVPRGYRNEIGLTFLSSHPPSSHRDAQQDSEFDHPDADICIEGIFIDADGVLGNIRLRVGSDSLELRLLRLWKVDGSCVLKLPAPGSIRLKRSGQNKDPNAYDDTYATCERTSASLLIYLDSLTAEDISDRLGIKPTYSAIKGMQKNPSNPKSVPHKWHLWFYDTERLVPSLDIRRHVDHVIERLTGSESAFQTLRAEPGVDVRFKCSWWSSGGQGGPMLWSRQLGRLAELDLGVEFEFAYYGGDD